MTEEIDGIRIIHVDDHAPTAEPAEASQALAPIRPDTPAPLRSESGLSVEQHDEDHADARIARRRQGNHAYLTELERQEIVTLYYERRWTQMRIAKKLGVDQSTISRTLARYIDTTRLAKMRVRARAEEIMDKIIDTAEPKELIKLLKGTKTPDGARVVDAEREFVTGGKGGGSGATNVAVGVKVTVND